MKNYFVQRRYAPGRMSITHAIRVNENSITAAQGSPSKICPDGFYGILKQVEEKSAVIDARDLPVMYAYKVPLRQVFQNLIGNALKYTKKDVPAQINISAEELKDHWQFAVTDNGIGIDKEHYEKIFIIFQRLHSKKEFSGTGIGLAITKKIIETMGGKIWVESNAGNGSAFYFTILKM